MGMIQDQLPKPPFVANLLQILSYKELLRNLVAKDLKLKYRGSFLGFLWSLLNPLAMIVVYTLAFQYILRIRIDNYPLFLITGIIPWSFFSGSAISSTESVISNANLIKKIHFPREILPVSTVLFNFAQLLLALVVFFPAVFLFKAEISALMLLYFPVLLLHLLFTIGVAFFLSTVTTFYRDIKHLTEVALMVLFWVTPIIYSLPMVPARLQSLIKFNPLTSFIMAYQDVIYWGRMPRLDMVIAMLLWTGFSLVVGYVVFRRRSPFFAEEL